MKRTPVVVAAAAAFCLVGVAGSTGIATGSTPSRPVPPSGTATSGKPTPDPARDRGALGLASDQALSVRSTLVDATGQTYVRYDRTWKGLRVLGGDILVHLTADGSVRDARFNNDRAISLTSTTARVSAAKARGLGAARSAALTKHSTATRVVWAESGTPRLAYDVLTTGVKPDQTPTRLHTIVDATSGSVITAYDEIETGTGNSMYSGTVTIGTTPSGSSFQLRDDHRNLATDMYGSISDTAPGTLFTDGNDIWGTGTNASRQTAAVDAQYGAEMTYDFYAQVLQRRGVWDTGRGARSRVHYGNSYPNAFWDGTQMTYGDGAGNAHPVTELDVAAHEMTHGVTENTAHLSYTGESGGINEATSDIFGTAVEFYANNASDPGDYLIGEKVDLNGNGTPLRYMDRPSRDGFSADCWSSSVKNLDVHYSSGPLNHWFYLASEGSGAKTINGVSYNSPTCDSSTVVGAGRAVAEKVWYRTLTTKLTSNSNYAAAREGAVASARELYGLGSSECDSVASAFTAIGVPQGAETCAVPDAPPATGTELVANGGFESGGTGWASTDGAITDSAGRPAHTGSYKAWLGGNGRAATEWVRQQITIPATATTATLSFWVRVDSAETSTTSAYDSMRPQITVGPTTTSLGLFTNRTATGGAFVKKTYDLSPWIGKDVALTFLMMEDSSRQTSFVVDDVSVTTT